MPRASQPHTPDHDLAAQRAYVSGRPGPAILTPDLADFCQSGVSVILAASGPGEAPVAGIGLGCRVLREGKFRILLHRSGNDALLATAQRGGRVSATFSQPYTHRSIQVKGTVIAIATASDDDSAAATRQMAGLSDELLVIGEATEFANAYCYVDAADLVAIDIAPNAAFVQTPGPGAGAELTP